MIALDTALVLSMGLTVIGLLAASIRLVLGPSRADRVVSLDLITVLLVAIAAQLSLQFQDPAYLDLGLAIALIGFLATVAFARYIEQAPPAPVAGDQGESQESDANERDASKQDANKRDASKRDAKKRDVSNRDHDDLGETLLYSQPPTDSSDSPGTVT